MDRKDFIAALANNPDKRPDTLQLSEIMREYPYFGLARILYLIQIKEENNDILSDEIKKNAVFLNDRKRLHELIHPEQHKKVVQVVNETTLEEEMTASSETEAPDFENLKNAVDELKEEEETIFDFPSESNSAKTTDKKETSFSTKEENSEPKIEKQPASDQFTNWLNKLDENDQKESRNTKDLIEEFISNEPGAIRADKQTSLNGDISKQSIEEDENYMTDTLAKIYIKQGLYSKAIYAYEKLSLKYPEKSAYFATQIEEIKRIIHNK